MLQDTPHAGNVPSLETLDAVGACGLAYMGLNSGWEAGGLAQHDFFTSIKHCARIILPLTSIGYVLDVHRTAFINDIGPNAISIIPAITGALGFGIRIMVDIYRAGRRQALDVQEADNRFEPEDIEALPAMDLEAEIRE